MDEYVKVVFPIHTTVWVDGQEAGFTNQTFQVETGHHRFELRPNQDCRPKSQEVEVIGTNPTEPMIISFTQGGGEA